MVYLAKTVLEGNKDKVDVNFEIPTLGSPLIVKGNTLIYDRPLIVTKDNIDQYKGF
jgi:simple sugar transport system substrate-binding protein